VDLKDGFFLLVKCNSTIRCHPQWSHLSIRLQENKELVVRSVQGGRTFRFGLHSKEGVRIYELGMKRVQSVQLGSALSVGVVQFAHYRLVALTLGK
jgi:hypothetical protein